MTGCKQVRLLTSKEVRFLPSQKPMAHRGNGHSAFVSRPIDLAKPATHFGAGRFNEAF